MGTSKINVWVAEIGQPCKVSNRDWRVAVAHCDGKILEWGGRRYDNMPAPHGHAEFEVPPGCYIIRAAIRFWYVHGRLYGNVLTDHAMVDATCGESTCIKLFSPTANPCYQVVFKVLLPLLRRFTDIPKERLDAVHRAMEPFLERLPPSDFDREESIWIEQTVQRLLKEKPEKAMKEETEEKIQ